METFVQAARGYNIYKTQTISLKPNFYQIIAVNISKYKIFDDVPLFNSSLHFELAPSHSTEVH